MKWIICSLLCFLSWPVIAGAPSVSCPTGFFEIEEPFITVATSCSSGALVVGDAESCLESNPVNECVMYVPVGKSYSDKAGTYEFTDVCPLL